ncbi:hypothetical protein BSKO_13335 [Bryopsis sp. KO-2023]|nr:hypothetical protein BSKO_13335 [Bryopsis sp. KO-2023]
MRFWTTLSTKGGASSQFPSIVRMRRNMSLPTAYSSPLASAARRVSGLSASTSARRVGNIATHSSSGKQFSGLKRVRDSDSKKKWRVGVYNSKDDEEKTQEEFLKWLSTVMSEDSTKVDATSATWELLETLPICANKEFLESMKPYPKRFPFISEFIDAILPPDANLPLEAFGYQRSIGYLVVAAVRLTCILWLVEPLLLYCFLKTSNSDLAHPLTFSISNLVGNFSTLIVRPEEPFLGLYVGAVTGIYTWMQGIPNEGTPEIPFRSDAALAAISRVSIALTTVLIVPRVLFGWSLADSLEVSTGLTAGWIYGPASAVAACAIVLFFD